MENYPVFHAPLEGVGFEYGFNSDALNKVVTYWKNEYLPKWSEREAKINSFPHFTTQIQGLNIHFIHIKPKSQAGKKVLPIILLHGWPGSILEFYDVIPKLIANKDYNFEIIVPCLPGYGWSQAASKTGLGAVEIGVIMNNLMTRLGFSKFYIQGGDWGSLVGSTMASLYPSKVIGFHANMCLVNGPIGFIKTGIASIYPSYFVDEEFADFFFPVFSKLKSVIEETGYMHIQSTKPDTIGSTLTGNPIGLAAYILEKFSTWTNPSYKLLKDGGLTKEFTLDALLDNIMVYYLTNSITTSQRLYAESFTIKELSHKIDRVEISVPSGCARFKNDLMNQIDWVIKDRYTNLIHSTYYKNGGHFAAFQLPEVFYKDLINFINKVENL